MDTRTKTRPALRFIPFRKRDIIEMCVSASSQSATEQMRFRDFCRLLQSVFHFEFHEKLEALKDTYAPMNPDRDTRKVAVFTERSGTTFVQQLEALLDKANYERLSDEDLEAAFKASSLFKLSLKIDFSAFDDVLLFVRGESLKRERLLRFFGLWTSEIEFANFDRVVIYIRFSEGAQFDRGTQRPGTTMLKMFQNVPKADIEMLFPNTRLGMRLIDKLMIGVPAILGGGVIMTTQLGTALILLGALFGYWLGLSNQPVELDEAALIAVVAGIGGLGSFIWKQFVNFKNRKLTFMQALTQNLYFKNLDNNAGVFHRLIDDAEEEECKEAILAYYFLLMAETEGVDAAELDDRVERWFLERWNSKIDFEIDDALEKLLTLGIVTQSGGILRAAPLEAACQILDQRWDEYFGYNASHPPGST
ncbi:MAG: TMEM143 family protein [Pseudomonadota bacterium]